ncbi:transcriptional regulator GlxA family with amidase domain [Pseudoclavibacter sp. JAI123]|uniref:DJ-1/PfpI family protein n=1 Tax=Pseudoclavibacter sp. JAI123 TaxID=2723065 RepID=UPI0015C7B0D0|nr:DJ-1/PfpI family protein [Pseudoclavibacter sp. JAI123]NYF14731.1 transcriptional regulator GlxA family with amidase domain [Pseudoclavibacter sp. JAI123]
MPEAKRRVTVVLFEGFELLDVFGPVELFRIDPSLFDVELIAPQAGPVRSSQGPEVIATTAFADAASPDIVLVPGGQGTRPLATDPEFLAWLGRWAADARLVTSVCTGSALLAAAGLLDGFRATSNKRAFAWASSQGASVDWVPQARWVEDGNRWTSSGVAAGMDMTAAIIAAIHGPEVATTLTDAAELEVHADASWDPYAVKNGLA